jgi:hypothetical protein
LAALQFLPFRVAALGAQFRRIKNRCRARFNEEAERRVRSLNGNPLLKLRSAVSMFCGDACRRSSMDFPLALSESRNGKPVRRILSSGA